MRTLKIVFIKIYKKFVILGNEALWHYLLAYPIVPAVLGGLVFMIFFPESPRALLLHKNKYIDSARQSKYLFLNLSILLLY
jgi:hypothetical protein